MATAAVQPVTKPAGPASRLKAATKGRLRMPLRYFFYGGEGAGKSTLAAGAPNPIWFDIEDGSLRLDVARYSFSDGPRGHVPATFAEVMTAIDDLAANPHDFKTLVIDTVDRLEGMIWTHLLERESQPSARNKDGALTSIESLGYGKGYVMAVDEWRALCVKLDRLRAVRGMGIVLIAHSTVKAYKNPTGPDFDRYQPALHDKAATFLKGWSDLTGFVRHEDDAAKNPTEKTSRPKGFTTGRHMLMLAHSAAYDAKSRVDLPAEIEIDIANPWAPLADAVEAGYEDEIKRLMEMIGAELARIGDAELTAKVVPLAEAAVKKPDAATLSRFVAELKKRGPENKQ